MNSTIKPSVIIHANLTDLQLRFVAVDHFLCGPTQVEEVVTKALVFEKSSHLVTVLMRQTPRVTLPDHSHMQIE